MDDFRRVLRIGMVLLAASMLFMCGPKNNDDGSVNGSDDASAKARTYSFAILNGGISFIKDIVTQKKVPICLSMQGFSEADYPTQLTYVQNVLREAIAPWLVALKELPNFPVKDEIPIVFTKVLKDEECPGFFTRKQNDGTDEMSVHWFADAQLAYQKTCARWGRPYEQCASGADPWNKRMVFNPSNRGVITEPSSTKPTMLHEFGHVLGLGDLYDGPVNVPAVMNWVWTSPEISEDDKLGLMATTRMALEGTQSCDGYGTLVPSSDGRSQIYCNPVSHEEAEKILQIQHEQKPQIGLSNQPIIALGTEDGTPGVVSLKNVNTGKTIAETSAFNGFKGGIRVAAGDMDGDGVVDAVFAPGPGITTQIVVFNGVNRSQKVLAQPFGASYTGGAYVAVADLDGNGKMKIIVGSGPGRAAEIVILDGQTGTEVKRFQAYESSYTGGVRVTTGDFDGDKIMDIVTSTPPGGGPRVRILNGKDLSVIADGFVYEDTFRGGVWVAAGDVDGDKKAELIVGADAGGGPRLRVLKVPGFQPILDTFVYDANFRGGVRVATVDSNNDGKAEIAVTAGPGGGPQIRIINGLTGQDAVPSFFGFDPNLRTGFYISGSTARAP